MTIKEAGNYNFLCRENTQNKVCLTMKNSY